MQNNLELSYLMVDEMHNHRPMTLSDEYWTVENLMKPPNVPPPHIPDQPEEVSIMSKLISCYMFFNILYFLQAHENPTFELGE